VRLPAVLVYAVPEGGGGSDNKSKLKYIYSCKTKKAKGRNNAKNDVIKP
jgi:hypothetical protein